MKLSPRSTNPITKPAQFRDRVLAIVRTIPRGETRTYQDVARAAGSPRAARAVGTILHRIWQTDRGRTIPCHRVILHDGRPGGYAAGQEKKLELLRREGAKLQNKHRDTNLVH